MMAMPAISGFKPRNPYDESEWWALPRAGGGVVHIKHAHIGFFESGDAEGTTRITIITFPPQHVLVAETPEQVHARFDEMRAKARAEFERVQQAMNGGAPFAEVPR